MDRLEVIAAVAAALLVGACNGGSMKLDDDSDAWWGDLSPDGETPAIVDGVVWCTAGSGSSGDLFFVEVEAFDPQGEADIAPQGARVMGYFAESGEEVFDDDLLVCTGDFCQGSWRDGIYDPVSCVSADYFAFKAQVYDRAGNASEIYDLVWTPR